MKKRLLRSLIPLGLYPHINFTYSPLKVLEFGRIMDRCDLQGDETALDIGCGDGLHTLLIGRRVGAVTGIDINGDFVADARTFAAAMGDRVKADFRACPIEKCDFPDAHFDVIFSICVIEHIPNYEEVLREAWRSLKPGGRMVFTVDTLETITDPELVASHQAQHHVMQYFREDTLGELLRGTGFVDIEFEQLFRSPLARELFERGIRHGFNFGRFKTPQLARKLERAEAAVPANAPGIFLLADARKPA